MYNVVWVDGFMRACIDEKGKANKYGKPKLFKTKKDADAWVKKNSYKGMSFRYEVVKADE